MNTWRDIKTDPPEIGADVFATDGTDIFYGSFETPTIFSGFDTSGEDYIEVASSPEMLHLKKWQPVPEEKKPEKTADEMFRELGYERSCADEPPHCILYERNLNKRMAVQIYIWYGDPENDFVEAFLTDHGIKYDRNMSFQETLACAQLIKEMEAKDE